MQACDCSVELSGGCEYICLANEYRFSIHTAQAIKLDPALGEFDHVVPDNKLFSNRIKASIGRPEIARVVLPAWVRYRMPMSLRGIAEE